MGDQDRHGTDASDDVAGGDGARAWSRLAARRSVTDETRGPERNEDATPVAVAAPEPVRGRGPDDSPGEGRSRVRRAGRAAWTSLLRAGTMLGRPARWLGARIERLNRILDRSGRSLLELAGRPWVLVLGVINAMVLVAGLVFLLAPDSAPVTPYVPVAGVEEVEEPILDHDRDVLFVPTDDGIHAFDASGSSPPRYCAESDRLESPDGRVWNLRGVPLDGGAPLQEHPLVVHEGTIYLDLGTTEPAPAGRDEGVEPACG